MAKSTGGTPGGTWKPTWDDKKVPPLKSPKGKPQDPPIKKAKKNPKSKGKYGKSDKHYEEDYKTDIPYGYLAKGKSKFKRDPRTGPNEA